MPPTYYRGCWHVVSRGFLVRYRHSSSLLIELYIPKYFFAHAASLHQGFPHCAIFPTAASRRSLGRVSVPMWPVALSGRLWIVALVGRYPANWLIQRGPISYRRSFSHGSMRLLCAYAVLAAVSSCYPPVWGRLPTRYSPVRRSVTKASIRRDPLKRFARLACVKHAASVHPEPGSNSLNKSLFPIQDQPFLANPSLVYCLGSVQKIHSQLNVRGCVLLFSCQASVCCFLFRWALPSFETAYLE